MKRLLKWTFGLIFLALVIWFEIAYWTSTNDCDRKAAAPTNPMKAIIYCDYGLTNLKLEDIEKPTPNDDQILVKVRAASVNPYDWHFIEGTPKIVRLLGVGLRKPKDTRVGVDFAGTVEAVGKKVTQFKPGDDVFGGRGGAFAEYVCRRAEGAVALKPASIPFEQAASVNIAGITALQAIRDKGKVQPGQKVLINGASGGVGTFAVQIAKSFGADVTGVCSTRNVEMVRSIGADHVVDYTKQDYTKQDYTKQDYTKQDYTQEDFTKRGQRYDLILDCVGNHSLSAHRRALNPNGVCVVAGAKGLWDFLTRALTAPVLSRLVSQKFVTFVAKLNKQDLTIMRELMATGKVTPVIDRRYSLSEVPEAIRYLEKRHARGKVVITLDDANQT